METTMKVSREQAERNRDAVLTVAARMIREQGIDGASIAQVMREAGLTHGGFYGQFESKDGLVVEACQRAFDRSSERRSRLIAQHPERAYATVVETYLTTSHRDRPGHGCAIAALATEIPKCSETVRRAFGGGIETLLESLESIAPGRTPAARRQRALLTLAAMVGALILARATSDGALSDELLVSVARALIGADER